MSKNSRWIGTGDAQAPCIRKEFSVDTVCQSFICICGLGLFELYINGYKVSEDVLTPVRSDYEERKKHWHKSTGNRLYYLKYDITKYLKVGKNALAVILGNGWYSHHNINEAEATYYGLPKLWFEMKIGEETICTDGTEKWNNSYIYYNSILFGEKQDLRLLNKECMMAGFDDSRWQNVEILEESTSILVEQKSPSDMVIRRIYPKLIKEDAGRRLYDAGENITGWTVLRIFGKSGDKVCINYAEEIHGDGTLIFSTAGWPGQIQREEYICSGENLLCHPHFTYHGFRYFEVFGDACAEYVEVVHCGVEEMADFECDNENINWFFEAFKRTQLGNMIMGIPTDCPHRERTGYTGDGQLCADAAMLLFDSKEFYRKWIYDIIDSQEPDTGHVPHTAPAHGSCGGGPGGWGCAIVVVPYFFYKHFGEREFLNEAYPYMEKWINYMVTRCEDWIVVREEEIGGCLGDWCMPGDVLIPPEFVNTYYFAKSLIYMKEIAKIIGCEFAYGDVLEKLFDAIKEKFYDKENNSFCNSVQGADVFALDLGIGNDDILRRAALYYDDLQSFDTGIFGTYLVIKQLFEKGYSDTVLRLLSSEKKNTFGYMRKHNATTLWERWNGDDYTLSWNSHNHPMFGAGVNQLFYKLLGFNIYYGEPIRIEPQVTRLLSYAKGSVKCERAELYAEYRYLEDKLICIIRIQSDESVVFVYRDKEMKLKNGENVFVFEQ